MENIGKSYTTETLKAAIAQSTLDKSQIKTILSANNLQGELLETTADELANAASTNMVAASQAGTTGTTLGLGTAFKGLGITIKNTTKAIWTFLTTSPVGWLILGSTAVLGLVKAYDALTISSKEAKESLEETNQAFEEIANDLKSINSKIETTNTRIDELNSKENLSLVEQQELNKLIQQNDELERELQIKERLKKLEQDKVNTDAKKYFYSDTTGVFDSDFGIDTTTLLDKFKNTIEEQKKKKEQIDALQKEYDQIVLDIKETEANGEYTGALQDRRLQIKKNLEQSQDYYKKQEQWLADTYKDFTENDDNITDINLLGDLEQAYNAYDKYLNEAQWKTKQIEGILSKVSFENIEEKLISMGKDGTLSIDSITSQFPELVKWLKQAGISVDEFYQHIMGKANPDNINKEAILQQMIKRVFGNNGINSGYESKQWSQINSNEGINVYKKLLSENDTTYWTSDEWVSKIISELQKSIDTTSEKLFSWSSILSKSFGDKTGQDLVDEYEGITKSIGSAMDSLRNNGRLTSEEIQELKEQFPELSELDNNIEITMQNLANLSDDAFSNIIAALGGKDVLPQSFFDGLQKFKEEVTKSSYQVLILEDAISNLDTNAELLSNVNQQLSETGKISEDTTASIIKSYPQMRMMMADYENKLIDEQTVLEELQKNYDQDVRNYEYALQAKQWHDKNYYDDVLELNGEHLNGILEGYKVDVNNCETASEAKLKIETALRKKLTTIWAGYYEVQKDAVTGAYKVVNNMTDSEREYWESYYGDSIESFASHDIKIYQDIADAWNDLLLHVNDADWQTWSNKNGSGSNSAKDFKETIDWIEVSITRATEALEKFTEARENAFDAYLSRDSELLDEINQTKELLSLQEKAAKKYREHAENIALSEDYKKKVQDGTIYIEPITDESSKNLIDEYTEWYNKSVEAEKQVRSLQLSLSELAKTKFDLITSQFDNVISAFETRANSINKAIELTEAKGYAVSTKYYESLIGEETENIKLLEAKRNELQKSLNDAVSSGAVKEASEEWNGMSSSISDVNAELEDANISLVEFSNTIRQLQWDRFDRLQDAINQITDESDFLMSLFENSDAFVKGGYITESGLVTAGQHAVNYNTLMRQADEYGNEYKSVMEDLAKDKNNQTLIDRTRELAQAQRDAIQSANDEKQALIDLAREGIEKEIEAMQELVDIKKKSLDDDYELYQRQQDLAEQSDELALLYKQQAAIQGDDSEGNMKRLQEVNEQIAEAEKQLQETEYDNWKTDQQTMLDNMMSEYEETQNERMQQTEQLFNDMINIVNSHSSLINDTIYNAATDVGYQISSEMASIWANNGEYQNTVSNYVNGADNRVNAVIEGINEQQKEQQRILDDNAKNAISSINTVGTKVDELKNALLGAINGLNKPSATPTTQQQPTQSQTSSSGTTSGSTPTVGSGGGNNTPELGDQVYASGRWYTSSTGNEAGIDVSELIGKIDYFKIEKVREGAKHPYWIQAYKNGKAQGGNGWVDLDQLAGYKNGIRKVPNEQLAWTNEGRTEGVYRTSDGAILTPVNPGDMIFSNEQMQRLWDISKNGVLPNVKLPSVNLPQVKGNSVSIGDVKQDVHINLPNVTDPSSFREAIKSDKGLRQQIQSLVLDPLTGRSSFGYKKY